MLVKLDDPAMFSKAIELISELVTEVRLKVNEFGMSITAMDPANVSMIESKGLNSARAEFSDDSTITGENCKSRYSLEYLSKFVKGSKLCDKTVLNFSQNNLLKIILLNLCLSE